VPGQALTNATLARAARRLAEADRDLGRVFARLGPPPLWGRRAGFATLLRIILEQQVSLASAEAMFKRLRSLPGGLGPARVAVLGERGLRKIGLTRQKASYAGGLARGILRGTIDLSRVARLPDEAARRRLMEIRGVGPWTADIYLIMALRRPDVWPSGDLALGSACRDLKGLRGPLSENALGRIAERWRPFRSVAARMLWQHYLAERGRLAMP
jgi:DNA-3-methyladenine glycosylase II